MLRILIFSSLLFLMTSCNKDRVKGGNAVEIYLLATYQAVPGRCEVDTSLSTLQASPFIRNEDILQYSRGTYEYQLTSTAMAKVKQLMGRSPFAVTVDKKVIFYGYYMPAIMSSTCFQSITMDQGYNQSNSIYMNLGYPGTLTGTAIDDRRNNATLLATFSRQGKLK